MLVYSLYLLAGFVLLYYGAEGLVRGSSSLARRFGVSPMVIGLTVVAYGTSMPEMVVSVRAALSGFADISIGNVVGSNIFNVAVILGITALINPLKVHLHTIKYDAPIMIAISLGFVAMFWDSHISRIEASVLFSGAIIYTVANLVIVRKTGEADHGADEIAKLKALWLEIVFVVAGIGLLIAGAKFLVDGAVGIAHQFGVSDAVIGLTIIAAGTSLPELATSVVAGIRKEADIAIGNIIGSNVFNLLAILGVTGLIVPLTGSGIELIDLAMMLVTSIAIWPLMRTGFTLNRIEGILLLSGYVAYVWYLISRVG